MPDVAPEGSAPGSRLARSSMVAFGIHVGGAGLSYCVQMLLARAVGADGFGLYAYVLAWMTMLAYLAMLGSDVLLLRFIPAYRAQGAWTLLRGVIRHAERWAALVGGAVVLVGIAAARLWGSARSPDLANTFIAGLFLVPILALLWIRASVVRAFGGVASALAPDRVARDCLLLGFVGFAVLALGWRIDALDAMLATVLSAALGLALVSFAKRRWMPQMAHAAQPASDGSTWAKAALPLAAIGVAGVVVNRTGVVLLGWSGMITQAGAYALAFNVAFLVVLPRTAINALFAPVISNLFVRQDMAALQALATKASVWSLLGAACIALPLAVFADVLLGWFGPGFDAGAPALRLLLLGQVVAAAAGSQLSLLTMTGHERAAAALMLANLIVNAAMGAALIHFLGLVGAAIGATASLVLWNVAMGFLVRRSLNLVPSAFAAFRAPSARRARIAQPQLALRPSMPP